MNSELPFRILLGLLLLGFVIHRGYYHRKLGPGVADPAAERARGAWTQLANLLTFLGLLSSMVYLAWPRWLAWSALPFPAGLRWSGAVVALAGFALLQWAQTSLGENWSSDPGLHSDQRLVRAGPYRWIRHPIYAAFLIILGAPLMISASWLIGLLWLAGTGLEVWSRIRTEEHLMIGRFGDNYRQYMKTTGRLLPRLFQASPSR